MHACFGVTAASPVAGSRDRDQFFSGLIASHSFLFGQPGARPRAQSIRLRRSVTRSTTFFGMA